MLNVNELQTTTEGITYACEVLSYLLESPLFNGTQNSLVQARNFTTILEVLASTMM